MFRGFVFGAFWGTVLGAIVLGLVSLISEVPGQRPPQTVIETPPIEILPAVPTETGVSVAPNDSTRSVSQSVRAAEPDASETPVLGEDVTSPAPQPTPTIETSALGDARLSEPPTQPVISQDDVENSPATPGVPTEVPEVSSLDTTPIAPTPAPDETTVIALPDEEITPAAPAQDATPTVSFSDASGSLVGLPNSASGVTTGRLPSIGAESTTVDPSAPPVVAFAADAAVDPERPSLAVVLLDDPSGQLGPAALQSLSFPVTVAISGTAENAADRMAAYRAAGFEVALNAELPLRASVSDIEAAFDFFFTTVPEAVAVLDSTGSGFRGDRRIINAVNTIIAESGHGLLTFDEGLNTVQQTATAAGIPVATIMRDLDANGQNPAVIRRFLDQSAFNARQDGAGIVLARVRPDTITALLIWSQQSRAQALNLVPASAILNQ